MRISKPSVDLLKVSRPIAARYKVANERYL